jgi:PKHD-type hydroxylase
MTTSEKSPVIQMSTQCWPFNVDDVENWAWADGIFTKEECEKIITIGTRNLEDALVNAENSLDHEIRKSKVSWISAGVETNWIFQRLTDTITSINAQYFKFDLWGMAEGLQFTKYEAPGGKYNPHIDSMYKGRIRKLSITVQLSDPEDYEGGELIINNGGELVMDKKQGRAILFPSYMMHGVKPVTKGTRYSLVVWITGPQFK